MTTSSPGYDDIYPNLIKQISTFISMPLYQIINCSLETGVVPSDFRVAKLVPIFLNGQQDDLHNYRPVSVLSRFYFLEKTIANLLCFF